ncbi:heavy metal sensor histidine kinase [Roseateles sp. BYS78W]|uniref:Sensor protein n=1 Tax=Pelomonas candidula TaxID=3299025 RepID=A0ABW7HKG7_9BURK
MNPRLDPRRWSLQLRLTLYFFVFTTALLCVVGWALNDQLAHQLWEKDEDNVRTTMDVQRAVIEAMDAGGVGARNPWQKEWAEHTLRNRNLAMRLTAPDGQVLDSPPTPPIPLDAFPAARKRAAFKRYTVGHGSAEVRYMLAATMVETWPGRVWLLQAAYNLHEGQELGEAFRRRLILVVTLAVLAASALAAYLVQRALRPLRVMSEAIGDITADKLDARIAHQAWPSDLRQLAESFDAMLGRLHAAFEQLSRFSSDLAHEFRSPITNLVSAAGVMLSRERSAGEYQDTLAVVVEEGDRLARMVSSMLFLARADNARQALNFETLSAQGQLRDIAEAYGAVAEERGLRLELGAAADIRLQADPLLLRNALSNLVSNALQHTPAGGLVTLTACARDGGVEFIVTDTGSGIAAEHQPHIFERFYRVDAARSSGDRTGLGLAVVRSIAELHGGRANVSSELGKGARFTLWLPFDAGEQRA